ncbi:GTPase IMAP family member 9-like isoform X2 [Antennarius striatus]
MKTLLWTSGEKPNPAPERPTETETSQRQTVVIGGRDVVVVDTPGLCNAEKSDEEVMEEIKKGVSLLVPGPHVFLFVLSCLDRFTKEDQDTVETLKKSFGEHLTRYTTVLFTCEDQLKKRGKPIEDFMKGDLQSFVDQCQGGFHLMDNQDPQTDQVHELLRRIDGMVQKNGGRSYADDPTQPREGRSAAVRRRVALTVNGSALVGAGLGGLVSHGVGSTVGIPAGVAVGAAVGGVLGCVGVVTAERIRAKRCVTQ